MKIAIASDHAGFPLKEALLPYLKTQGYELFDFGCYNTESVDYPDYAEKVARAIVLNEAHLGILICGTGVGMCIAANKIHGIRAAVVSEPYSAQMSREHNNANILCIGSRVVNDSKAKEILDAWLKATYAAGRHEQRLKKIEKIEYLKS